MRSLLRSRARSFLKSPLISRSALHSSGRPSKRGQTPLRIASRVHGKHLSSSTTVTLTSTDPAVPTLAPDTPDAPETPADEPEKPKRRTRTSTSTASKESEIAQLPSGLDILWTPGVESSDTSSSRSAALPPVEILEDALHNLHIILHPQTQHRATYSSLAGPPVEPTLALYCPIEGGEYVIDETVRELARRTGSEVLVLDAVQLAAGEWGHFGKGEFYGLFFWHLFSNLRSISCKFPPITP